MKSNDAPNWSQQELDVWRNSDEAKRKPARDDDQDKPKDDNELSKGYAN